MKRTIFFVTIFAFLAISLAFKSKNTDTNEVEDAKAWFNTNMKHKAKDQNAVLLDWSKAEIVNIKGKLYVDIPSSKQLQTFNFTEVGKRPDKRNANGSTKVIIIKDEQGNYTARLLRIYGKGNFGINSRNDVAMKEIKFDLPKRINQFSGFIWQEDFDGVFHSGFEYENGRIIRKMEKVASPNVISSRGCGISGLETCYNYWDNSGLNVTCSTLWYITCWPDVMNFDPGENAGTIPDYYGNNGGGGGDTTPDEEKPCPDTYTKTDTKDLITFQFNHPLNPWAKVNVDVTVWADHNKNGGNSLGSSSGAEFTSQNSFRVENYKSSKCYASFKSVSNVGVRYKNPYGWNDYTNEQILNSGDISRYWTFQ